MLVEDEVVRTLKEAKQLDPYVLCVEQKEKNPTHWVQVPTRGEKYNFVDFCIVLCGLWFLACCVKIKIATLACTWKNLNSNFYNDIHSLHLQI